MFILWNVEGMDWALLSETAAPSQVELTYERLKKRWYVGEDGYVLAVVAFGR